MKVPLLLVLAASLTGVVDRPPKNAAASGLQQLQGSWELVAMERSGRAMTPAYIQAVQCQLRIQGNNYQLTQRGRPQLYQLAVAPRAASGIFDLKLILGNRTCKGIGQLEGATLKVCYGTFLRDDAPTSFATQGTRYILYVFRRAKS